MGAICVFYVKGQPKIREGREGSKGSALSSKFHLLTIRRKLYQVATQHAGAAYGRQFLQSVPQACVAAPGIANLKRWIKHASHAESRLHKCFKYA